MVLTESECENWCRHLWNTMRSIGNGNYRFYFRWIKSKYSLKNELKIQATIDVQRKQRLNQGPELIEPLIDICIWYFIHTHVDLLLVYFSLDHPPMTTAFSSFVFALRFHRELASLIPVNVNCFAASESSAVTMSGKLKYYPANGLFYCSCSTSTNKKPSTTKQKQRVAYGNSLSATKKQHIWMTLSNECQQKDRRAKKIEIKL